MSEQQQQPDTGQTGDPKQTNYALDLIDDPAIRVTALVLGAVLVVVLLAGAAFAAGKTVGNVFGKNHKRAMYERYHSEQPDARRIPRRGDSENPGLPREMPGLPGLDGLGGSGLSGLLGSMVTGLQHGEVVVAEPGQPASTLSFVRGEVRAVRGNLVTVRASDGYLGRFTVTSTTRVDEGTGVAALASVPTGTEVFAYGTVAGSRISATMIRTIG